MSILVRIFADKRLEVAAALELRPFESMVREADRTPTPPDFLRVFRERAPGKLAVIAEIKRRSPSKGILRADLDPARMAETYMEHGAAAVSVLTDEKYFGGSLADLTSAASAVPLPVLRKDFIFSPYQVYEAKAAGAAAVLLIAGMLSVKALGELIAVATAADLSTLVEVHAMDEIDRALAAGAELIGINNRNLHSFEVRLETTFELRPHIPAGIPVIAESGIRSRADITALLNAGVDGVLIGETLVKARDPGALLAQLAGVR
jgi:indole-3-glycerol phosphate synthase